MKPGQPSQTAVLVCMGRAAAHGITPVARFSDPTALALLPDESRARVERYRAGVVPSGFGGRFQHEAFGARSKMMVARTVAIDDAIREAPAPQVVILGAGLDGRAWRMPELRDVTVFEVDHPDSQREKRQRIGSLAQTAREVKFVAMDFTRDSLDGALSAAGHDPALPTTWIWEGVVMYLALSAIEATLSVIERRSLSASRLIVAYNAPSLMLRLLGVMVARLGEPFRSAFSAAEMSALLQRHHFAVVRDEDVPTIAHALSPELGRATRRLRHARIVVADATR